MWEVVKIGVKLISVVLVAPVVETVIFLAFFLFGYEMLKSGNWWGWLIVIFTGFVFFVEKSLMAMMLLEDKYPDIFKH